MKSIISKRILALILLGITVAPIFISFFINRLGNNLFDNTSVTANEIISHVNRMEQWGTIFTIWIVATLIFYLAYLYKTDHVSTKERPFWTAALVLGNIVAMPIFWYRYIWQTIEPSHTSPD